MSSCARPPADRARDDVRLALPDDLSAPGRARTLVRESFRAWQLAALVEDAELAVSELVTNALLHGLPPVVLVLTYRAGTVRVDVSDRRPKVVPQGPPVASQDGDESGRGQGIVSAVSDRCGVDPSAAGGKSCYASWDVAARAS